MNIGIPKERQDLEMRVGLTPYGVGLLTRANHVCYIERGAGEGAGFTDYNYERAGGRIVYSTEEVYRRADMLLKAVRPTPEELEWLQEGQILGGFLHLAAAPRETVQALLDKQIAAIAYETVQEEDGSLRGDGHLHLLGEREPPCALEMFFGQEHLHVTVEFLFELVGKMAIQVDVLREGLDPRARRRLFHQALSSQAASQMRRRRVRDDEEDERQYDQAHRR